MIYYLNKETVPAIPTPHDCLIKKVSIDQNFLTLIFEDDISAHDSIKSIQPHAKSLIVRIHLIDVFETFEMKYRKMPWRRDTYALVNNQRLVRIAEKERLEYLHHYVGCRSMIIKLICQTCISLDIQADYIEFDWIMQ